MAQEFPLHDMRRVSYAMHIAGKEFSTHTFLEYFAEPGWSNRSQTVSRTIQVRKLWQRVRIDRTLQRFLCV
jgi:hypothetical protein